MHGVEEISAQADSRFREGEARGSERHVAADVRVPRALPEGDMFAGTYQDKIVVRFGGDRMFAGAKTAKSFEPMPGRAMKEYLVVPEAVVKSPAKLRAWIDHAHSYAKTLPAKKAR
jgi:hypothetical protein